MTIQKAVPFEEQIMPMKYLGNDIKLATAEKLMKSKPGKRNQLNGLVYRTDQMPTKNKKNRWNCVLRSTSREKAFEICTPLGKILVHFLPQTTMNPTVSGAVNYFLENHSRARNISGETGYMVAAGVRVDLPSSTRTHYVSKNKNTTRPDDSSIHLQQSAVAFDDFVTNTCCNTSYKAELNSLKKKNNVLLAKDDVSDQRTLFPSYAISQDLTNSIHVDTNDDSRSYAVFYGTPGEHSLSWLLFPVYKIAIEICTTVMVSWDGRCMDHCSCSVRSGVYSFFASSYKDVTIHCLIEKGFKRRKYNKVSIGNRVFVRDTLRNMIKRKYITNNTDIDPDKFMFRQAIVLKRFVDKDKQTFVAVEFVSNLNKIGEQLFSIDHVCRLDFVYK